MEKIDEREENKKCIIDQLLFLREKMIVDVENFSRELSTFVFYKDAYDFVNHFHSIIRRNKSILESNSENVRNAMCRFWTHKENMNTKKEKQND